MFSGGWKSQEEKTNSSEMHTLFNVDKKLHGSMRMESFAIIIMIWKIVALKRYQKYQDGIVIFAAMNQKLAEL